MERAKPVPDAAHPRVHLPKDALSRVDLGHSFAEYDPVLSKPGVFVHTPQIALAANDGTGCFFVGRRGTGKTATTVYLVNQSKIAIPITPQLFDLQSVHIDTAACRDTRQRQFRSLVLTFFRAMVCETVREWLNKKLVKPGDLCATLSRERNAIEDLEFDVRVVSFIEEYQAAEKSDKEWLKTTRRCSRDIPEAFNKLSEQYRTPTLLLFDRIDEAWDGSEQAVVLLMALMHACVELHTACHVIRPKLFLRENIFERVREMDNEFSRLETFVVSMDWTQELLLEMVERRLGLPFNTKLPLHGPTWDYFFEGSNGESSRKMVFEYCQERPRDVLTYSKFAIESAQSRRHERVTVEDLLAARKRFSDSRLKDLGDEYAENYPQIQLLLSRFFGLGTEFTIPGIEAFIKKLLVDDLIQQHCGRWIYQHTTTDRFVHLLYNIGFFGIGEEGSVQYRSLGAKSSTPPAITGSMHVSIHPSYQDALSLQNVVIGQLDENVRLRDSGLILELPEAVDITTYRERLQKLNEDLKTLPMGSEAASRFEDIVGDVVKLCFFRALQNVQPQERSVDGRVKRDWIASNRAYGGFWETVKHRYGATQIIWECKNYADLQASDFQQFSYYMTDPIGRFCVCSFRGEMRDTYYEHIRRIASEKNGVVLLLTDKDMQVFIRQAIAGKIKEDHIQDIYDRTVRKIS